MKLRRFSFVLLAAVLVASMFAVTATAEITYTWDPEKLEWDGVDDGDTSTEDNEVYIDKTSVKVEWEITDVNISYSVAYTWNSDEMKWERVATPSSDTVEATATFNVTNNSSTFVKVNVEFATDFEVTPSYTIDGGTPSDACETEIPCVIDPGNGSVNTSIDHDKQISASVSAAASQFLGEGAAASGTFGTYRLTISKVSDLT